jgi:hypothetical protein
MIELEACLATQPWVNREYRRGLSTYPCGAPVLRISEEEVLFSEFHHLGATHQGAQDPVAHRRVQTQGLELDDELGGYYGVEC